MKWAEVRRQFPEQWVGLEALQAHTDDHVRQLDDLAVIDSFANGREALKRQHELHQENPMREYYFFHTSRPSVQVIERRWSGIRGAR